ncbi:hypothetical protein TALK_08475 [Thalassospira alkalitolerans]|uniref:Uncharacterized protein n=1 Tax=Thalassospira alkalitolerans TaxID=1293890 RepID=A0A1Y2LBY3_9PROT|nr:hypothetical protein TALK_08475 [Thalassospira alkalitolerans]
MTAHPCRHHRARHNRAKHRQKRKINHRHQFNRQYSGENHRTPPGQPQPDKQNQPPPTKRRGCRPAWQSRQDKPGKGGDHKAVNHFMGMPKSGRCPGQRIDAIKQNK